MRGLVIASLAFALAACGSSSPAPTSGGELPQIANGCFALDGDAQLAFFWKPSGLGTYLLYDADGRLLSARDGQDREDAPGPLTEWSLHRIAGGGLELASTSTDRRIAVASLTAASGCEPSPEAAVNAIGAPITSVNPDGTVRGFVDLHLHITAELRAGGETISGEPFNRFGIVEALGRDANVHGPDGALDVTGNLLRSGNPVGTHDTHGWPTFAGWPVFDTNTHQQVYYRWLERAWMAGERLVVAMTVEDHPLCVIEPRKTHDCDETHTIELEVAQLAAMQDYIDAQSGGPGLGWFRLVYDPAQARQVIEQGKLAVVIGVESSNPFGCSELLGLPQCTRDDIDRGIAHFRALGVRSVFPAHWTDNALAGAALEGGDKGIFIGAMEVEQTGHPFAMGACPDPSQGEQFVIPGKRCNTKGLTDLGEYLIQRLIDEHMLIEADHMSELARDRVLEIAESRHYPIVSSHTNTGGLWTDAELDRLYAIGGIATARVDQAPAFAARILELEKHRNDLFYFGVGFGTDTGGFASLPAPRDDAATSPLAYPFTIDEVIFDRQQSGERTYDLNKDGVAHYGLIADLVGDLQQNTDGAALEPLFRSAEAYLQMWQRAYSSSSD